MQNQASFDHCEALVRAVDKDRFLATLFAPAERRGALFALYAFNVEIGRVRERAREPMPGEIRLQWWRDVFDAGHGDVRANPVAAALLDTVARHHLPREAITALVDAHTFDLYDDPMGSLAELEAYAAKTSASLIELAALILVDDDQPVGRTGQPNIQMLAMHAGTAHAVAGLLASFAMHAARRRLYVPLDVITRHGVATDDIFAGKATPELRAALADMRLYARGHLSQARALIRHAPASVMPAFLPTALARPLLDRMEARGYDPFEPVAIAQWRRQWILWRAARSGLARVL